MKERFVLVLFLVFSCLFLMYSSDLMIESDDLFLGSYSDL